MIVKIEGRNPEDSGIMYAQTRKATIKRVPDPNGGTDHDVRVVTVEGDEFPIDWGYEVYLMDDSGKTFDRYCMDRDDSLLKVVLTSSATTNDGLYINGTGIVDSGTITIEPNVWPSTSTFTIGDNRFHGTVTTTGHVGLFSAGTVVDPEDEEDE